MSSAKWIRLLEFGSAPPFTSQIQQGLKTLQSGFQRVKKIYSIVEQLVKISSKFVVSTSDASALLIKQYALLFKQILQNISSLGGHAIFIHPWNRFNKKFININFNTKHPIKLPSMTPYEAFLELEKAFYNTKDKMRPRWGSTTKATGYGFLLVADTPTDLLRLIQVFNQFFNLNDLKEVYQRYQRALARHVNDLLSQNQTTEANAFALEAESLFNIIPTEDPPYYRIDIKKGVFSEWWETTWYKEPRWIGLSLINLPKVASIIATLTKYVEDLEKLADSTNNAIKDLTQTILKKINYLLAFIENFYKFLESFLTSLSVTNIYLFLIPPGTGGVSYIIRAIQNSLNTPQGDAIALQKILNQAKFSTLFFMGASPGVDQDAWYNTSANIWSSFTEALSKTAKETARDFWEQIKTHTTFDEIFSEYAIIPGFLKDNGVIPINTSVKFSVISANPSLYYSYTLSSLQAGILSSFSSTSQNKIYVNKAFFTLDFRTEGEYTLSIQVFSDTDSSFSSTRTIKLQVVKGFSTPVSPFTRKLPTLSFPPNTKGILKISDISGILPTETHYVYNDSAENQSSLVIGNSFPNGSHKIKAFFRALQTKPGYTTEGNEGDFVFNIKIDTSHELQIVNKISPIIYVNTYPTALYFDFEATIKIREKGSKEDWLYINFPTSMVVYQDTTYEYAFYISEHLWGNVQYFSIQKLIKGYKDIC